ncbi:hypothetical protein ACFB49_42390 [Sphingomonas sp. DBB INV C78]|uniref:phosphotransferase n=1 Tax=Sphingomonas sp. DBB INV C78 TaxID=3349434 RepID=UPI0036D3607F
MEGASIINAERSTLEFASIASFGHAKLKRIGKDVDVADSSLAFHLRASGQRSVLLVSPARFPNAIREDFDKAATMKAALGRLGDVILTPTDTGHILNSSFAVVPYRRPLFKAPGLSWADRRLMRGHVASWLENVAGTFRFCGIERYQRAVETMRDIAPQGSLTQQAAIAANRHLINGYFRPVTVPMHGDLWRGNVLRGKRGGPPLHLIDWGGSLVDGYPILDLLTMAGSFHIGPAALARELGKHYAKLECRSEDMLVYLMGGLGHLANNLGEFPIKRFHQLAENLVTLYDGAIGGELRWPPAIMSRG